MTKIEQDRVGIIMTRIKTTKLCLLSTAGLMAVALPVMAGHNALPLRGAWNAPQYAVPAQAVVPTREHYIAQQTQLSGEMGCCGHTHVYGQTRTQHAVHSQQANYGHAPQPVYAQYPTYGAPADLMPVPQTLLSSYGLRGRSDARRITGPMQPQYANNNYNVGGLNVRTSAAHTDRMLDWQENTTGKALTLLQHRRNGILAPNSLYLGAGIKGGFMYQKTEVPGQFPILSRFPFFSNRTDDESGVFAINNAALAITGTFGDWTTIYLQPEYSETEYRADQDEMQLRKAFVTFGNLDKTPFYAAFGRKTIDFGNFDGYNPFVHTEAQHYFWAASDQPVLELGYYNKGLKITGSAFSGGRQLRTAFADENNNIANYAASIEKEFLFRNGGALTLGTSYLHDSIYRDNFTAHTFGERQTLTPPANFIEYRNSVGSAFVEYNSPVFDAMLEYTSTFEPWAAAIPQDIDGNIVAGFEDFDEKLSTTVAQVRYKPRALGGRTAFSAVGTWGNISDDDYVGTNARGGPTSFGKNEQHVLGVEHSFNEFIDFGAEYVYNKGFIPFVAPQQVSNQDTEAHAINIGFKARF